MSRAEAIAAAARNRAAAWRLPGSALAALAALALALAMAASVALGTTDIPLERTLSAFTDFDGSREHVTVMEARVPRALIGAAVGAALGVAGALIQAVSRNPLAEPGLLGVSWGAALAAVGAQGLFGVGSSAGFAWVAMGGAAAAGAIVVGLASAGQRGMTPERLVVAGAAVSILLWSLLQAILVLDAQSLEASRRWLAGSLTGVDLDALAQVLPYLGPGLMLALLLAPALNVLALGDDIARGLGQRVGMVKAAASLAVVLLTGGAVALAGPMVLIGLAVPHMARALVGRDLTRVLPLGAVGGAVLVLAADVAARFVLDGDELPVGVVVALVGAPFFLHVARRGVRPL